MTNGVNVKTSAAATPLKGTTGCCGATGAAQPNHCKADPAAWTGAWPTLDFEIDEDTLFYYDYDGTATSFTAKATGDLDCDGSEIVYALTGSATNGSPTDAADRLHLHRNTVLYRLGRIEDLLGADLRNAEVRLALHLALKIGDVLEG